MSQTLLHINDVPLAGLMLVVTFGYLFGRLSWRGLSLGPAGGTLLVAIVCGSWGLTFRGLYGSDDPKLTIGMFGFALFIYSVGFEAGPRFFSALRGGSGWRFALLGALVNVLAVGVAVAFGRAFALGADLTAGMLAGGLTSAPTYAAATAAVGVSAPLAVSFALTFPFGLVGVALMVQFLPRLMKDDLTRGVTGEEVQREVRGPELRRAFLVTNETVVGRSLRELDLTHATGCYVSLLHRQNAVVVPDADTVLGQGDHVMAKGRLDELQRFAAAVGPEVYDEDLRKRLPSPRAVRVNAREVTGKTLAELQIVRRFHCLVTAVERGGVHLEPSAELRIEREDMVLVVGRHADVRDAARFLGRFERSSNETDIAVYAGGILLGLLLGNVAWHGFGVHFRIGAPTGLLFMGVLLGRFRRIGRFSAHVPAAARQLVRDLGILLFISETGVRAGGSSMDAMHGMIWVTVVAGAVITVVPVLISVLVGRHLLKMRPIDAWGSVCGGMTSSSALVAIRAAADSNEPAISYAAAYAVASVLATLAGQIVVLLV